MTDPTTAGDDPEVVAWQIRYDELDAAAAAALDAGDPHQIGPACVDLADHLFDAAAYGEAIELLHLARDAYIESGDDELPTRCAMSIGLVANHSGDLPLAQDAFRVALDEWEDLQNLEFAAGAANNYGTVSLRRGEYAEATEALVLAISYYQEVSNAGAIPEVRVNLGNVYRLTGRFAEAQTEFLSARTFFDDSDHYRRAQCDASLGALYTENKRPKQARAAFESAIETFARFEAVDDIRDCELGLAHLKMMSGDTKGARDLFVEVRKHFDDSGAHDKAAAADYNMANMYALAGEFTLADNAFDAAAAGLGAAGLHHQLANLQWNKTKRLLLEASRAEYGSDALAAQALDSAVSSLIATEHQRFQFVDVRRRQEWSQMLAERVATTFAMIDMLGSTALLADLIDTAINAGVHTNDPVSSHQPAFAAWDDAQANPAGTDNSGPSDGFALTMAAVTLLTSAVLPMDPPPALLSDGGRVMLERQRDMAAQLDPALGQALRSAPRVSAW